jgi:hypothetical protein
MRSQTNLAGRQQNYPRLGQTIANIEVIFLQPESSPTASSEHPQSSCAPEHSVSVS